MNIRHHPSEETLIRYAGGFLAFGAPLVVAAHLGACATCRRDVRLGQAIGGALLNELAPAEIAGDALARLFARLESPPGAAAGARGETREPSLSRETRLLPPSLQSYGAGARRWLAPGIWTAPILEDRAGASTYLLRVARGRRLPHHGHRGSEMTCVLAGSFSDSSGEYRAGDFVELDGQAEHQPVAGRTSECICLISAEGRPRIRGLSGWLFRTVLRLP
jgi:putative transcriptional regulator